jgi:hypothetical protein
MATLSLSAPAGLRRTKQKPWYQGSPFRSVASALVVCSLWIALGWFAKPVEVGHDFGSTYASARMAINGAYDAARTAFRAFLISPLARFPQPGAFRIWVALQLGLLLICWIWAAQRFGSGALIWGALSAPCVLSLYLGQDSIFLLAIAAGGYALAKRKQSGAAGAVLALALIRSDLVLFIAPAMLLGRRWKMFGGFAVMAAALLAWCLALGGAAGLESYAAQLFNSSTPAMTINIQGLLANLHADSDVLRLALTLAALASAVVVLRERLPLWRWMSLTITVSLFTAPHANAYDAAIMLLPVWLVRAYSRRPATRTAFAVFATPVPFLAGFAGSPWSILTPVCLAACFSTLAWEAWAARRDRREQLNEAALDELTLAEPVL